MQVFFDKTVSMMILSIAYNFWKVKFFRGQKSPHSVLWVLTERLRSNRYPSVQSTKWLYSLLPITLSRSRLPGVTSPDTLSLFIFQFCFNDLAQQTLLIKTLAKEKFPISSLWMLYDAKAVLNQEVKLNWYKPGLRYLEFSLLIKTLVKRKFPISSLSFLVFFA